LDSTHQDQPFKKFKDGNRASAREPRTVAHKDMQPFVDELEDQLDIIQGAIVELGMEQSETDIRYLQLRVSGIQQVLGDMTGEVRPRNPSGDPPPLFVVITNIFWLSPDFFLVIPNRGHMPLKNNDCAILIILTSQVGENIFTCW